MEDETAYSYHEDSVHEVDAQQARVMGLVTANVLLQLMAILTDADDATAACPGKTDAELGNVFAITFMVAVRARKSFFTSCISSRRPIISASCVLIVLSAFSYHSSQPCSLSHGDNFQ